MKKIPNNKPRTQVRTHGADAGGHSMRELAGDALTRVTGGFHFVATVNKASPML